MISIFYFVFVLLMEVNQFSANQNINIDKYNYCSIGDLSMTTAVDLTPQGDGGVLKEVIKVGSGNIPEKGSKVFVHFSGFIVRNEQEMPENQEQTPKLFLNTRESKTPFTFVLGEEQTIPGLDIALTTMKEGESAIIYCKSNYGYGNYGNPMGFHSMGSAIPAFSTLKFELEFLSFDPPYMANFLKLKETERRDIAKKCKDEGNDLFKLSHLERAHRRYSRAIELMESLTAIDNEAQDLINSCNLNIAAVYLKKESFKEVIEYCSKVLEKETKNVKALFRRGKGYSMMNELDKANDDLLKALELDSSNQEIKRELAKVKAGLEVSKKKEKQFYGSLFKKLSEESKETNSSLYQDKKVEEEPKTKKCSICQQEVDTVQWARHVIKYHGSK